MAQNDYTANWGRAFFAGVIGGGVMTLLLWMARATGMTQMNLSMMMGAMFTQDVNATTWWVGFFMHLMISGLIGIVYGLVFEAWGASSWWRGVVIAIPHIIVTGVFMWMLPMMHPAVPEHPQLIAPGFLAANYGAMTVIGVIVLHLIYGAIVGVAYKVRPEHAGYHGFHRRVHV